MIFLYLILAVILLVYVYLTWNFDYWSKRGVPSAKARVLLGDLPNIILRKENLTSDFAKLYTDFKDKTPFVGLIQIRSPRLMVFEPELIKDILIRKFKNFHDNEFSDMIQKDTDPLFARNPFFLTGEEWKEKRAEITPAFTTSRLKALFPLVEEVQGRMIKYIQQQIPKNEAFDAREVSAKFTVDSVSLAIFGIDAQSFTKENPEIREMGRRLLAPAGWNIIKMFLIGSIPILKKFVSMKLTPIDIEQFFINLMDQALKFREDNNVHREDFLDYLIQLKNKKGIQKIDMAAHTISFFTDGFETSSIAIAHILYELGNNKHSQEKLRDELNQNYDKDGKINYDALNELPYLDQVISETLRMHSPALFTSRVCTEATELSFGGKTAPIEKGMNVYIPIHQLHFDPEHYPDPEKFQPERFDPENGGIKAFKDKGVFLAFGDGPRMCLGMRFALLQIKVAVAGIVKNFEITINKKTAKKLVIDPKEFLNIKKGGLWVDFKQISEL